MDLTGWIEFFTNGLATQLTEVKARGEAVIRADVVARTHKLNQRQSSLLRHLMLNDQLAIAGFEALLPDVNRRTLQRDLKVLVEKHLVAETGSGPTDKNRKYRWNKV